MAPFSIWSIGQHERMNLQGVGDGLHLDTRHLTEFHRGYYR